MIAALVRHCHCSSCCFIGCHCSWKARIADKRLLVNLFQSKACSYNRALYVIISGNRWRRGLPPPNALLPSLAPPLNGGSYQHPARFSCGTGRSWGLTLIALSVYTKMRVIWARIQVRARATLGATYGGRARLCPLFACCVGSPASVEVDWSLKSAYTSSLGSVP